MALPCPIITILRPVSRPLGMVRYAKALSDGALRYANGTLRLAYFWEQI
ncbi:hypothetical protein [Coleofasciculus sp. F4-SAH-05]